ncbi:hypothetical protein Y032_0485g2321 [Ancylostoma ceylanicum]|uniref:Uncharacterized protein n=1 Tax=Ancylostoma ceylanicum TaxID=53326 RepID=A0A016WVN1_9BILA|nr:hypothetical protein Y032_0485g2321 [Ancylostoma ceylanicum]
MRLDCHVISPGNGSLPKGARRPYSRGCAQNEPAMWVLAEVEKMPVDCHSPLIIIPPSFEGSSFPFIHVATAGGRGDRDNSQLSWASTRLLAKSGDILKDSTLIVHHNFTVVRFARTSTLQ